MDDGGSGWVREGDKAPSFELPDTNFKAVNPLSGAKSKVRCGVEESLSRGSFSVSSKLIRSLGARYTPDCIVYVCSLHTVLHLVLFSDNLILAAATTPPASKSKTRWCWRFSRPRFPGR